MAISSVTPTRLILVGNYRPDRQESMLRFEDCLTREYAARGLAAQAIRPEPRLACRARTTTAGLGKWLAYLDKYVIFPRRLRGLAGAGDSRTTIFHILDHSNAIYQPHLRGCPSLVTCHDLLAVRGGLGDASAYCPASPTGRILQRWILQSLCHCPAVACVSQATRDDFERLTGRPGDPRLRTIPMGNHAPFVPMALAEAQALLPALGPAQPGRYLLHVGSGLPRKNREALLRILALLPRDLGLQAVFAGEPLRPDQWQLAKDLGVADRVREVIKPDFPTLNALYAAALALVFPSRAEGFGWPVLEAQAAGCPVITSNRTSLPEVGGEGGWLFDPDDVAGMAEAVPHLLDPAIRGPLLEAGRRNLTRFTLPAMIDRYLACYREILQPAVPAVAPSP